MNCRFDKPNRLRSVFKLTAESNQADRKASVLKKASKAIRVLREREFRSALFHGVAASVEHDAVPLPSEVATVLDIGANRGQFAIYACGRFPGAMMHCFEPIPEARAKLESILPSNRDISVHGVALSAKPGVIDFYVTADDDSSSIFPASEAQVGMHPGARFERTVSVNAVRLDDQLAHLELGRPVLMKIDVQGAELEALKGGTATLSRTDYVLVECSFVELYDGQALAEEVFSFLESRSFDLVGLFSPTVVNGRLVQADALFTRSD